MFVLLTECFSLKYLTSHAKLVDTVKGGENVVDEKERDYEEDIRLLEKEVDDLSDQADRLQGGE